MYATFFGLRQEPFSIAPDPRYLYMSERHREALAHLLYGVRGGGGGFVLLTGEIGAGKTTVCRCFLEQVPKRCNVAYIFNPALTVTELLQSVCEEFRIPLPEREPGARTVKDYVDPINEFLLRTHAVGQNNVLIIDEAQNLSVEVLEQLRLLTNLETAERKLLQIVLIGQPELRDILARPDLEQLAQRVTARYHLGALSERETALYIRHRMQVAGLTGALPFDRATLRLIHRHTGGVPRRINLLCDRALLGAYGQSRATVGTGIVDRAAGEVFDRRPGLPWLLPRPPLWLMLSVGVLGGAAIGGVVVGLVGLSRPAAPLPAAAAAAAASAPASAVRMAAAASAAVVAAPAASVASGALAAPVASAPAALATPALTASAPVLALRQMFPTPLADESAAWRQLVPLWGHAPPPAGEDVCAAARRAALICYRDASASLTQLRVLSRPGIVWLREDDQPPVPALLVGLDERQATLRSGDTTRELPLPALAAMWRGEFATFWRAPTGYDRPLNNGAEGPVVNELAARLAQLAGRPAPTRPARLDARLRGRVQAFQVAHGLRADGLPGPETFMQLNRVTGVDEPRLSATPPRP